MLSVLASAALLSASNLALTEAGINGGARGVKFDFNAFEAVSSEVCSGFGADKLVAEQAAIISAAGGVEDVVFKLVTDCLEFSLTSIFRSLQPVTVLSFASLLDSFCLFFILGDRDCNGVEILLSETRLLLFPSTFAMSDDDELARFFASFILFAFPLSALVLLSQLTNETKSEHSALHLPEPSTEIGFSVSSELAEEFAAFSLCCLCLILQFVLSITCSMIRKFSKSIIRSSKEQTQLSQFSPFDS